MEILAQNGWLQLLLICVLVVLAVTKVTLQGASSRRFIRGTADSVLFNAQLFAVIALIFAIVFPKDLFTSWHGWVLAAASALGTFVFQVTYALALQCGPVSLSVLIVNFNVLLTTGFSIVWFGEAVYLSHMIGILLLVSSMCLSIKKETGTKRFNVKWLILLVLALVGTASGTIITQVFTKTVSSGAEQNNFFVVVVYSIASLLAFGWYFIGTVGKKGKKCSYGFWNPRVWLFVLLIGADLGIFQLLYIFGISCIDGAFLFPTFSGMQSVAMALVGIVLFKDKLSKRQIVGVILGISCVVMMNMKFVELL